MRKLNWALSIAAGLLGGFVSHYMWIQPVHARSQDAQPQASITKEIRAESFVLVDNKGHVQGVFSIDESKPGPPVIKLSDSEGREIWRAGGSGFTGLPVSKQ